MIPLAARVGDVHGGGPMADPRAVTRKPSMLSPQPDRRDVQRDGSPWREDAHAVIIGINEYVDPKIPNLRFARADAEAVYRVLTDPTIGRFKPDNVTLLLDAQATERNIRSALGTQLPRRAGGDSTVFIYFAGHGAPVIDPRSRSVDGLEKYLIPHDAVADDLRASGIAMDTVQQYFSWLTASQVICFLDSCYSGSAGGRSFDHPAYQTRAMLSDEFLESLASEGRFVVTACGANEVSLESPEAGHGIFTRHLVEGLRGAADADGNGKVTIDELYEYIYEHVERDARALGGSMKPVKKGSVRGTVYLTEYETAERKRARELLQGAREAWQRGEHTTAATMWRDVLAIDATNTEAAEGIASAEAIERQRADELKKREKILLGFVNGGTLSMREYNRALTLLSADPATLNEGDRHRRRFLDSLIAGELTIGSYTRSIELLETHTDEYARDLTAAAAPPPMSRPVPPEPATDAAPRKPSGTPGLPNESTAASRADPAPTSSHRPPPPVPSVERAAPGGISRTVKYAVAAAVGAAAIVMTIVLANPGDGDIAFDETAAAVPASPESTSAGHLPDTVAEAGVETGDSVRSTVSDDRPEPKTPSSSTTERSGSGGRVPFSAPLPQPLQNVAMVEPAQTSDVRVLTRIRLRFELEPGDRLDPVTTDPRFIRLAADGAPVQWRIAPSSDDGVGMVVPGGLQEFNTQYTVTIDTSVRTVRGRRLAAPVVFTFTTAFWDPQHFYRLSTDRGGPNVVLAANPQCSAQPAGGNTSQDWYFTPSGHPDYYVMRNAARGDDWALEGALPPDECYMGQTTDPPTGMLWKAEPTNRPGRFFLRNMNFENARSLTLGPNANTLPLMQQSDAGAAGQYWTFTRARRR